MSELTSYEQEMHDRVVRIESRIVQLGDHVGANLRTKARIDIIEASGGVSVEVDALDVSVSRIYAELHRHKFVNGMPTSPIMVYCNHKHVITVMP